LGEKFHYSTILYDTIAEHKMSTDTAAVTQVVAGDAKQKLHKKKATSNKSSAKKAVDHPKYSEMVQQALTNLKERGGSSRQAVLKYIMKNFNVGTDENVVNTHLKIALKSGVKNASLKQSKGSGAAGSFRIGEVKKVKTVAKKTKTAGKSVVKKTKSPTKKAPAAKKPSLQKKVKAAEKKVVKKQAVAKKVQKPKTAQKVKKATSPVKKTAKPSAAAVKKTPVKAAGTKKTAAAAKKV
jgi:histone H1/5